MAATKTARSNKANKANKAATPVPATALVAALAPPAVLTPSQPVSITTALPVPAPVATPAVVPVVVGAPRPVAATPVAVAVAAKLTAPVVAGGPASNARLTGTMLATLQALANAGTAITHTALALATGRNKGNQLRPLLALGYTSTHALPGTRGYVYSITPAGSAALAVSKPATPAAS